MAESQGQMNLRINQGPTSLVILNESPKIISRGSTIEFASMSDLMEFTGELNIIMVELAQEIGNPNTESKPTTTDDDRQR